MPPPRFAQIKQHILQRIACGDWRPGTAVPSENQLAGQFSVSRMTARRALSELTQDRVLERIQGSGTFVAEQLPTGSLLEIRNIAEEIAERGHRHRAKVLALETRHTQQRHQHLLDLDVGQPYWFSQVLHFEDRLPIQLEERMVNPHLVPDYLHQDFSQITPNAYLTQVTPLSEADHWVEAIRPHPSQAALLQMDDAQPCLKISRRTYTRRPANPPDTEQGALVVVNFAQLYHPGTRYRLGGHLNLDSPDGATS